jgi:outer membrane protein TolC
LPNADLSAEADWLASKDTNPDTMNIRKMISTKTCLAALFLWLSAIAASAQLPGTPVTNTSGNEQPTPPASENIQPLQLQQFNGSGIVDKPVPGVLKLSLLDVIDRGIKHNLGLLLSQQQTETARAQRWRNLSSLLPNVAVRSSETVQQINLAAFGIPVTVNGSPIVGPFAIFDARPTVTERLLDFNALNRVRAAAENEKAARHTVDDARELVVLVVGNQYLLALADAARLQTAQAELATAKAIYDRTADMKKAGVAPQIDVLRAQVEMQQRQQRVLAAQNQLEQQRMSLERTIGLPVTQQIELTDTVPYGPVQELNVEEALERAYGRRPEYLAAESLVRSAEMQVKAAKGEALPTLDLNGDYGAIGPNIGTARATFTVGAGVRIPIFQGGRVRADVLQAETILKQQRLRLQDLRARIEFDVRSALLDVKTSEEQISVAKQSVGLSNEQLKQAQDRYGAGVSGSLEVVQAQEAVTAANETYIQALYLNNVAKLALARGLGVAEQQTRAFLEGRK